MNSTENSTLPRLFEYLKENKMTVKQVSDATGIPQTTIASWRSGARRPKYDAVKIISDYLHVSIDYLLGYDSIEVKDSNGDIMFIVSKDIIFRGTNGNGMSAQSKMIIQRVVNSLAEMSEQDQEKAEKMINVFKE